MSRSAPRKARHRRIPSGNGRRAAATSDYDSDAAQYTDKRETDAPAVPVTAAASLAQRDNNDLNYRVLRRYIPNMRSILAISSNAVVYNFGTAAEQPTWEKSGYEGTTYVVELEPLVVGQALLPQACIFVLNRRGLDNLQLDLARATDCEDQNHLVILRMEDELDPDEGGEGTEADGKVVGIWIHQDPKGNRDINASIILAAWQQCRAALAEVGGLETSTLQENEPLEGRSITATQIAQLETVIEVAQPVGRKLSITDLFGGQRNGNG